MDSSTSYNVKDIYQLRFQGAEERRNKVWQVICRYGFQKWIPESSTVLDLGGGYGEFINNIQAKRKILVDINPDSQVKANPNVETMAGTLQAFEGVLKSSVDVIFCSNFLEHLPDKNVLVDTIRCCHRILKEKGRLIIMGPNIRFLASEYWDFLDHHIALSDRTMDELLGVCNFDVIHRRAKFLPYTFRQNLPSHPFLVQLYLQFPLAQSVLGKQFLFVSEKKSP